MYQFESMEYFVVKDPISNNRNTCVLYYTPCDEEKENSCKKLCVRLCAVGSYLSHLQAMHVELAKNDVIY